MRLKLLISLGVMLVMSCSAFAQFSTLRQKQIVLSKDAIKLDSLSIFPGSLTVTCNQELLPSTSYSINYASSVFKLLNVTCSDSLVLRYRVMPFAFGRTYSLRDSTIIYSEEKGDRDKFLIEPTTEPVELFGGPGLQKSGSISRGIAFGNKQDLSVNSSLNLELSGYVAPNLQVLASVTDDNLPIQPEGNTNKLQEFDQVFIQLFNDQFKLTAGDFWINKPTGYFLTYKKRGQGLTGEYYWQKTPKKTVKTQVSGALSKGKFNRQVIPGVEGNQGPYRLRGNENEPFIIVLSGTERIFLDGKLLTRGQEYDYTIDYNTSELSFTARHLITKDSRLVAEFQYSDQNYARSLVQFSTESHTKKMDWWVNAYSEQDAKNQPLQQNLTNEQKFLLSNIGDNLLAARSTVIDSVGYLENQVLYLLKDSLGYDSVLVVSVNPSLAVYRATFAFVGAGKGDYVFQQFNALGRVYKWVAPVNGISIGDYAPVTILITPKQQQLISAGANYHINDRLQVMTELSRSGYDLNTFSRVDSFDDDGYGLRSKIEHKLPFGKDSLPQWNWTNSITVEALDPYFRPIEQYRAVEFDRDWNTRNQTYSGNQVYSNLTSSIDHRTFGKIVVDGQLYKWGDDFTGYRGYTNFNWAQRGFRVVGDASTLQATATQKNTFIRHRMDLSKQLGRWIVGYKDDQEKNEFSGLGTVVLDPKSYGFFDYQGYLGYGDTTTGTAKVSYRERIDERSDSTRFQRAAKAKTWSGEWTNRSWKNQQLTVVANYRSLEILNEKLISQKPENTTNGRIDHDIKLWKNSVSLTTFYEVGAGLEQRKEFIYIKVNDGQGVYTWNDYNADGVKDLNEFEIAAYADQASYVRVFTPSNEYSKTYNNEYNQSLNIRPERIWASKTGMKKLLSRFSTQSRFRIQRKTSLFQRLQTYNPFVTRIADSNLISAASTMKHTLFFNRTSSIIGADYGYQRSSGKTLLATGFDGRSLEEHELSFRWNIRKEWTINGSYDRGLKVALVDYTVGRNYRLNYWDVKPELAFQPNTSFRISVVGRMARKTNDINLGGEFTEIRDLGTQLKYNQSQKGSFQTQFNYILIQFAGNPNTPLGFELLEALKPGKNLVWSAGYQRTVSKNLQLSIQYNGRQSEGTKTIHAGGMELKAFF